MTLSSRHRIRNSSPGGLRPSTLPLGHGGSPQYWLSHVDGEETFFVTFKPPRPGTKTRAPAWKAAVLTTTLGPRPFLAKDEQDERFSAQNVKLEHWRLTKSGIMITKSLNGMAWIQSMMHLHSVMWFAARNPWAALCVNWDWIGADEYDAASL